MASLQTEADTLARMLGKSAVGYISAESANLWATERAAEAVDSGAVPSGGRAAEAIAFGLISASWIARYGLHRAQARQLILALEGSLSASGEASTALQQAIKAWGAQRDLDISRAFMRPADAVLAESPFNEYSTSAMDRPVANTLKKLGDADDRVSQLAKLSQRTEAILKRTSSFTIAATAASLLWTANAMVMSDELIDNAIGSWHGAAAGARTIFSEWMPAIRASLFPDWTGAASTAASERFATFIDAGMAFADQAERMAVSLTTVVGRLNDIYWAASAFAMAQFGAMIALSVVASVNPQAAALLRYLGLMLRVSVTLAINAILAALGALVSWTEA